jgi:hypothetical protein
MVKQLSTLGVPHHHIKRAVIWYLVILIAGAAAVYVLRWWYGASDCNGPCVQDIKDYSLGAEVTSIDASKNQLSVKTGWASNGDFVYYDRQVNLTLDTKILVVTKNGTAPILNENPIEYFKVGDKITVYGAGNAYSGTTLTATKIEIQR